MDSKKVKNGKKPTTNGTVQHKGKRKLPIKQFQLRESLLTDLFENPHISTVHHLFVAVLISMFVHTTIHDLIVSGEVKLGFRLIWQTFTKIHIALIYWMAYFAMTCLCYFAFILWAKIRLQLPPKSENIKLLDVSTLSITGAYYLSSFYFAALTVKFFELPPASAAIVTVEQVRLLMKLHAFIRENVPLILSYKPHSDQSLVLPQLKNYVYFLFAPTLVFREHYPRTKAIKWSFAFYRLCEVIGVIFFYSFIFERHIIPRLGDFGLRKYTWTELFLVTFENTITGMVLLMLTFYLILHSWQNMFAEVLRFGDREFYRNWWQCSSYAEFFRTWNVVVHDWLYTYVYKDMYEYVIPGSKLAAKLMVFTLSAIVHEWILILFINMFFPMLLFDFLILGAMLSFVHSPKTPVMNVLFWYGLSLGSGQLVTMYTVEYMARINAPVKVSTWWNTVMPRLLTCDCF